VRAATGDTAAAIEGAKRLRAQPGRGASGETSVDARLGRVGQERLEREDERVAMGRRGNGSGCGDGVEARESDVEERWDGYAVSPG
jgi:hypothetical protein